MLIIIFHIFLIKIKKPKLIYKKFYKLLSHQIFDNIRRMI